MIEEALRKQREETEKAREGLTIQASPPPLPEQEGDLPVEEPAPERKAVPVLIAAVAGGILVLAVIVWVLLYGVNFGAGKNAKSVKPGTVGKKVEAVDRKEAKVKTAGSTSLVPAKVTATQAVAVVSEPTSAVPVVVAPVVVTPVAATGVTVATATEVRPVVQKITVVTWPRLTITGLIGAARDGKGAAIINGQMVMPGALIEGVRVEAIGRQGVKLSFEGESKTLSVGGSTE